MKLYTWPRRSIIFKKINRVIEDTKFIRMSLKRIGIWYNVDKCDYQGVYKKKFFYIS